MLKTVSCNIHNYKTKLNEYLENNILKSKSRINSVRKIINEVQKGGDKALLNLTNKYDNNNFKNIKEIEVSQKSIENSIKLCSKEF